MALPNYLTDTSLHWLTQQNQDREQANFDRQMALRESLAGMEMKQKQLEIDAAMRKFNDDTEWRNQVANGLQGTGYQARDASFMNSIQPPQAQEQFVMPKGVGLLDAIPSPFVKTVDPAQMKTFLYGQQAKPVAQDLAGALQQFRLNKGDVAGAGEALKYKDAMAKYTGEMKASGTDNAEDFYAKQAKNTLTAAENKQMQEVVNSLKTVSEMTPEMQQAVAPMFMKQYGIDLTQVQYDPATQFTTIPVNGGTIIFNNRKANDWKFEKTAAPAAPHPMRMPDGKTVQDMRYNPATGKDEPYGSPYIPTAQQSIELKQTQNAASQDDVDSAVRNIKETGIYNPNMYSVRNNLRSKVDNKLKESVTPEEYKQFMQAGKFYTDTMVIRSIPLINTAIYQSDNVSRALDKLEKSKSSPPNAAPIVELANAARAQDPTGDDNSIWSGVEAKAKNWIATQKLSEPQREYLTSLFYYIRESNRALANGVMAQQSLDEETRLFGLGNSSIPQLRTALKTSRDSLGAAKKARTNFEGAGAAPQPTQAPQPAQQSLPIAPAGTRVPKKGGGFYQSNGKGEWYFYKEGEWPTYKNGEIVKPIGVN